MKKRNLISTAIAAFLLTGIAASSAQAQNANATPTYGEIRLVSGFLPDPHILHLQAGGPINAAEDLDERCMGFIASAPDVNLRYQTSGLPLYISVESESDTTLIIEGPDHRWYCVDDTVGLNPVVILRTPQSGRYSIWVGTYRHNGNERAVLKISELEGG